jgi:hypothetical protein
MKFNPDELSDVILNKTSSKNVDYNSFLAEGIFYNNMIDRGSEQSILLEHGKEYNLNRYGFRSPPFIENVDFLFSGCSITYGVGLEQKDLWHERLVSKLGGSHASIAFPGDSVSGQVLKIFSYIQNFGNPKNIICLFPNFDRFLMYNNKKLLASDVFFRYYSKSVYKDMVDKEEDSIKTMVYLSELFKGPSDPNDSIEKSNYFKTPLSSNQVITQEISYMYSAQMINMLSQYCKMAGIQLIWSTWDNPSAKLIEHLKNNLYFNEYTDVSKENWNKDFKTETDIPQNNCHLEFKNHPDFHFASDRHMGLKHAHYGMHRQLHYFDNFLNKFKEIN